MAKPVEFQAPIPKAHEQTKTSISSQAPANGAAGKAKRIVKPDGTLTQAATAFKDLLMQNAPDKQRIGAGIGRARPKPAGVYNAGLVGNPDLALQLAATPLQLHGMAVRPQQPSGPPPAHLALRFAPTNWPKHPAGSSLPLVANAKAMPGSKKRKIEEVLGSKSGWEQMATRVKGRSEADRAEAKEEYAKYAKERLEVGCDPEGANMLSSDWWYCQVCLCCLVECDFKAYINSHVGSAQHAKKYQQQGGFRLADGFLRPDPQLENPLAVPNLARFLRVARFAKSRVLSLGEQDYSFSLAVAKQQLSESQDVQLVATSYLGAHDPEEPEVHVKDDGMKAHYSRKSLPSMGGQLLKNIAEIEESGGKVFHSVDATDLRGTLLPQCGSREFDVIVFPFPRASLIRGIDPRNPRLLRNFFRSVNDISALEPGGIIALVLLRSQYADWDVACVALEAGYCLRTHTALPDGFYQSREMSGKPWKPEDAEIYIFEQNA